MNRFLFIFLFVLLSVPPLGAAQARARSGDMFDNAPWNSWDRPRVPSDRARGEDMFAPIPVLYNSKADLFDGVCPTRVALREDMLSVRPAPPPVGKMFGPWADR